MAGFQPTPAWASDPRLERGHRQMLGREALQAESTFRSLLRDHADCLPAAQALIMLAADRGDHAGALSIADAMLRQHPDQASLHVDQAHLHLAMGQVEQARATLDMVVQRWPAEHVAWLMLADAREACGDDMGALRARWQGITRAQSAGLWLDERSTDPGILDAVRRSVQRLQQDQRACLMATYDELRRDHGDADLSRVHRALTGYLGDWDATPPDPRQRPKFFYFPDLPPGPYHDPMLHPWAAAWQDSFEAVRGEALALLAEDRDFESFLGLAPGQKAPDYVGGSNPDASWDAYFFWRHGRRFDEHHARCPRTSAALSAIDLCHVERQAPEVCFSVIRPQSTIMPHYGVTNTRLVMHLPLLIPGDCALHIVDGEAHYWKEGELMLFDDTYQHGAWNHTDQPRLIVLMDCWNPHLRPVERVAVKRLIEVIDRIQN